MTKKTYDLTKCKGTREKLIALRDTYGLKWSEILEIYPFSELPPQTLSMIYHGKRKVPKVYCELLGEPVTAPAPVCTNSDCEGYGKPHTWDCRTQTIRSKPKSSNSRALSYTRKRRERLNAIAREAGYKSWSSYETAVLNERKEIS